MSEKYINLAPEFAKEHNIDKGVAGYVLRCLDEYAAEHPDQVPGRTIMESELSWRLANVPPYADKAVWLRAVLNILDITVVPDPEPTNAEKLADYVRQMDLAPMSPKECGKWLDEQGVKAPGGDDE